MALATTALIVLAQKLAPPARGKPLPFDDDDDVEVDVDKQKNDSQKRTG